MMKPKSFARRVLALTAVLASVGLGCVPEPQPPRNTTTTSTSTTSTTDTTSSTSTSAPTTTTSTTTTTTLPPGLLWSDEFDGPLSPYWRAEHSTYGDGNNELACLTPNNVAVSQGTLKITSRRETATCPSGSVRQYTSGFISTRPTGNYFPAYGRFEARVRAPQVQGMWPAVWLRHRRGSNLAEVDILEVFHTESPWQGRSTLHLSGRKVLTRDAVTDENWHIWSVTIRPEGSGVRFSFTLDGFPVASYLDNAKAWLPANPNDGTWDIAVNQAVGGNWIGSPDGPLGQLGNGQCGNGGSPPNCNTTGIVRWTPPEVYEVDWVRVYRV